MTPAETIIDRAAALGVALWVDTADGEDVLRYLGPAAALDILAPAVLLHYDAVVELLRDRLPGEPARTAAATYPCPCCERFFSEDRLGIEGWCRYCLAVVLDECIKLDQRSDEPEENAHGRDYLFGLR